MQLIWSQVGHKQENLVWYISQPNNHKTKSKPIVYEMFGDICLDVFVSV